MRNRARSVDAVCKLYRIDARPMKEKAARTLDPRGGTYPSLGRVT